MTTIDPPRLILCRSIAFIIDILFVGLIFVLLVTPVKNITELSFSVSGGIYTKRCGTVTDLKESSYIADLMKADSRETFTAYYCQITTFGLLENHYLTFQLSKKDGNRTQSKSLGFAVGKNLKPVKHIDLSPFFLLRFPLILALMTARWHRTFGKLVMKIEVKGNADEKKGIVMSIAREYLKFAPIVIIALGTLVGGQVVVDPSDLPELVETLGAISLDNQMLLISLFFVPILAVIIFIFYLVDLIRWKGAMFYDRILKFRVGREI